ncbi:MAG: pantoate--beta-alanine ligase [Elusimicrobia bacterium]|nr:pantoate--beta-alanine ligase [Elusimicrobiota bacterium]
MKLLRRASEAVRFSDDVRRRGLSLGFVPTMGALHAGHLSLIRRARRENHRVAVSIFVNPLQFGPTEDYSRYPRPVSRDTALCRKAGADVLLLPEPAAMYPEGFGTHVEVEGVSDTLCGSFRPGHFRGVATVVLKLFNMMRPHRAYFGEKDYQQLTILRRMSRDLNVPIEIVGCPTVREADGLALSSRNAYLAPHERAWAPRLYQALSAGAAYARTHPGDAAGGLLKTVRAGIDTIPGARPDYVALVDAASLEPAKRLRGELRLLAAVRIGKTRLIDNIPVICKDKARSR